MRSYFTLLFATLTLAACDQSDQEIAGFNELESQVSRQQIGSDTDQWIERFNLAGEWERVGLIFGYVDDFGECQKAIAGLKLANPAADYRCVPANH